MIIALSGIPGAGKDTVGNLLASKLNDACQKYTEVKILVSGDKHTSGTFKNVKFAKQAYGPFVNITGVSYGKLVAEEKEKWRPLFKKFAESMKNVFGADVWAKALLNHYPEHSKKHWVITDLRFFEEVNVLREEQDKGEKLFLIRLQRTCDECGVKDGHENECSKNNLTPEETKLSNFLGFDLIVDNDTDPDLTAEKILHFILGELGFFKTKLI